MHINKTAGKSIEKWFDINNRPIVGAKTGFMPEYNYTNLTQKGFILRLFEIPIVELCPNSFIGGTI